MPFRGAGLISTIIASEARELQFNVLGLEQEVSRKLSIFDIWYIHRDKIVTIEYTSTVVRPESQ